MRAQVAISRDFMEAYSRLPRRTQKKVREFTVKFQQDPTQSGLNFERIAGAADDKVRSVRIDQAYRAIVVHPPRGDVFLCVWVDHHDDAYSWVQNKKFEVNPRSGAFQLFDVQPQVIETEAPAGAPAVAPEVEPPLFADVDDEDLLLSGVPEILLPAVKALRADEELEHLLVHLPSDAGDMLYLMAAGYSLVDAMEQAERERPAEEEVDVHDFAAALNLPESKAIFWIADGEVELEQALDAPLEQWRIFLHPSQRSLVEMHSECPVRVLGGAGTGKTVILMHRANFLASDVFTDADDRILVTTFTRNLALDLEHNLRRLCSPEAFRRLEVVNLHRWTRAFWERQGHPIRILQSEAKRKELMEQALVDAGGTDYPLSFYLEEWDRVVQAWDVDSRDAYFTARRTGRGTKLGRVERAAIWKVFERYRRFLDEARLQEWQDVIREARLYTENQPLRLPYRAVLADEAQDFTPNELKLLRTIAPEGSDTLFLTGDGHQRIYGFPIALSRCGIEIEDRPRRLQLNYRTTEQIRDRAVAILPDRDIDDLNGGVDTLVGFHSVRRGPPPEIRQFDSEAAEAEFVLGTINRWIEAGSAPKSICLSARTHSLLSTRYEPLLKTAGLDTVQVETDPESEAKKPGVRLATMHRMKGLEFSCVLLAGVQRSTMPLELGPASDAVSADEHELQEQCLLYVACTRARDELVVCGFGEASPFLE